MLHYDELRDELERLSLANEIQVCPVCHKEVSIVKVKKDNDNYGRPFVHCKSCETFFWWDVPKCPNCGLPLRVSVSKSVANKGRSYKACWRDKCYFRWL